jgi:hypothetical protein
MGVYGPEKSSNELVGEACVYFGSLNANKKEQSKSFVISEMMTETEENHIYKVMFDKPVKLKAGETMTLSICINDSNSYYGSNGNTSVTSEESGITFTFTECPGSENGTSVESGQIPEIYFYH